MENATKQLYEQFLQWAQAHENEMLYELSEWVQIPSVRDNATAAVGQPFGADCAKMADHVIKRAKEMGFACTNHEGYCVSIQSNPNALREIGILPHLDVVPAAGEWTFPPFCGMVDGGFVYGRGSHDDKSAAVMSLYLLRALREMEIPLKSGVRLIMGLGEETGMEDMEYYVSKYPIPRISLVPDSCYPVNIAQKSNILLDMSGPVLEDILSFEGGNGKSVPGHAEIVLACPEETVRAQLTERAHFKIIALPHGTKVCVEGVSVHPADPEKGVNAIALLAAAIAESNLLGAQSQQLMERIATISSDYYGTPLGLACEETATGKTTAVVTRVHTENGRLILSLNCRVCHAITKDHAVALLRDYCEKNDLKITGLHATPGVRFNENDPAVRCLQQTWHEATGRNDPVFASGGNTYSRAFPNAITFGIIGGGFYIADKRIPAGRGCAHEADEYIHSSVLTHGLAIYGAAVCALDRLN